MEIFLTILSLLGIGILSIFTWIKKLMFKRNIEFHEILKSFPLISKHRINRGSKTSIADYRTDIKIQKEFTEFMNNKKNDLDEFLVKIENFDTSKLKFKKKEIESFVNNIKAKLTSESQYVTITKVLDLKTQESSFSARAEPFEWTAFNYIIVYDIMRNQKRIDELYVFKKLKF